jgi:hypothetical protein
MSISVSVELVTPTFAALWLSQQEHNRTLVQSHVERLIRVMKEGQFQENGQAIVFDAQGRLVDGQHRLRAIVASGTSHRMVISRGVGAEAQATMDTGRSRSVRDVLSLNGHTSASELAAMLNICWSYDRHGYITRDNATTTEAMAYLSANPSLTVSLRAADQFRALCGSARPAAGAWLIERAYGAAAAAQCLRALAGEGLSPTDPVFQFRRRLDQSTIPRLELMALLAKAFSQQARGLKVKLLRLAQGERVEV